MPTRYSQQQSEARRKRLRRRGTPPSGCCRNPASYDGRHHAPHPAAVDATPHTMNGNPAENRHHAQGEVPLHSMTPYAARSIYRQFQVHRAAADIYYISVIHRLGAEHEPGSSHW